MPPPVTPQDGEPTRAPLPRRFWLILLIIFLVVAAEWSMAAWAADYMVHDVGLVPALASGLMSFYYLPMVIGRFVGSRLTRRANAFAILPAALVLSMTGFLIFWLAPFPVLNVIGLFITGLGVANLYPLSLAVATVTAGDQTDRASALIAVPIGTSILVAPLILGIMADGFGIRIALGQMLILFIAAMGVFWFARQQDSEVKRA